jgi:hypothetical protein
MFFDRRGREEQAMVWRRALLAQKARGLLAEIGQ